MDEHLPAVSADRPGTQYPFLTAPLASKRLIHRVEKQIDHREARQIALGESLIVLPESLCQAAYGRATQKSLAGGFFECVIETLAAFPDGQYTMHEILADGDKVVLRWSFSGTQRGEFMGIPPTGRRGTMTGISIFGFKDGLISEFWEYYDSYDFLQQLGAVPALG